MTRARTRPGTAHRLSAHAEAAIGRAEELTG
jgi:hypothetical protein